jgi:hypothetical protein
MSRAHDLLYAAMLTLDEKPPDSAPRTVKQRYSQRVSAAIAQAFAEELRERGMRGVRPSPPGEVGLSGAERRISGGIGAKKVDVSWSTEESGLVCGISIKSINFRDQRTGNFQKNITNRRGDLLFESVTLHRRFPYSVLFGFLFLDHGAETDSTDRRRSTFLNAHHRLRLFTGRDDPGGRDEQYERLYVALMNANRFRPTFTIYEAGIPEEAVELEAAFDLMVFRVAERNPDFYEAVEGQLSPL